MLSVLADGIGLFASCVGINTKGVTTLPLFVNNILSGISFGDVVPAVLKTFFFGFAVGLIGCYTGYYADKGTEGVGQAANSAGVASFPSCPEKAAFTGSCRGLNTALPDQ